MHGPAYPAPIRGALVQTADAKGGSLIVLVEIPLGCLQQMVYVTVMGIFVQAFDDGLSEDCLPPTSALVPPVLVSWTVDTWSYAAPPCLLDQKR